jgi:8-oxo-dGTP diphosphatase
MTKSIKWSGLLVIKDRKVLMTKEEGKDFFMLPGGRSEGEETSIETLIRELQEELSVNLDPNSVTFFAKYILPGKAENEEMEFTVYTTNAIDFLNDIKQTGDIIEIQWLNTKDWDRGIKTGSVTTLKVFPELKEMNLID